MKRCPSCGHLIEELCPAWIQISHSRANTGEYMCSELPGHAGDHVARHVFTGLELFRWRARWGATANEPAPAAEPGADARACGHE